MFCFCLYESIRSPETGVIDSYELPCRLWELNPGPLKEQLVLLTSEPCPSPLFSVLGIGFLCISCCPESHHVIDQAGLKLLRSACLCLLNAAIKGVDQNCLIYLWIKKKVCFYVCENLSSCTYLCTILAVPLEARRGQWIPWS